MRAFCAAVALSALTLASARAADGVQRPFYQGKLIRLIMSTGTAGGYAAYARPLAAHLGDHLPGNPTIIVESMPGAGGLLAANYIYNEAPKDGTVMAVVHSSVPLAPLWGNKGVRFDTLKFNWIGAFDSAAGMCISWHASPIRTWSDMLNKTFTVGSSGVGSQMDAYPAILNRLFKTKIKVIGGYKDGTDVYLAMQRGEVEGRCGGQLAVLKSTLPDWLTQHKFYVPITIADKRIPDFPDTPTIMEFVKDEATRAQLELLFVGEDIDRPVMMPPGVPADRVQQMRDAFDATMKDPAFLADLNKERVSVDPTRGIDMQRKFVAAYALPASVIAGARGMMSSGD